MVDTIEKVFPNLEISLKLSLLKKYKIARNNIKRAKAASELRCRFLFPKTLFKIPVFIESYFD